MGTASAREDITALETHFHLSFVSRFVPKSDTYDSHTVSHGVSGQILVELGTDAAVVSVQSDHLSPHGLQAGLHSGMLGHATTVLGLVNVNTTLANVEATIFFPLAALDLQRTIILLYGYPITIIGGVCLWIYLQQNLALVLVAESSLVASEHGLGVQTSRSPLERWSSDILGGSGRLCGLVSLNHFVCPGIWSTKRY